MKSFNFYHLYKEIPNFLCTQSFLKSDHPRSQNFSQGFLKFQLKLMQIFEQFLSSPGICTSESWVSTSGIFIKKESIVSGGLINEHLYNTEYNDK